MSTSILTLKDVQAAFPPDTPRAAHIAGVVALAQDMEELDSQYNGELIQAALYHDIGYAAKWRHIGFHPVDGALLAREHGLSEEVAQAILHHGGSWLEARLIPRTDGVDLSRYYADHCRLMEKKLYRAFTYCDSHTGPNGQRFTLQQRLDDIRARHVANKSVMETMAAYESRFKMIDAEFGALFAPMQTQTSGIKNVDPR